MSSMTSPDSLGVAKHYKVVQSLRVADRLGFVDAKLPLGVDKEIIGKSWCEGTLLMGTP